MIPSQEHWQAALIERHGMKLHNNFSAATAAICGLGGLGSNIAVALARAGVGKLILIDFDKVDISNLHRQQYKANQIGRYKTKALAENLLEINPYIRLETVTARVDEETCPELLSKADIVCEAFDDPEDKAMLTDSVLEKLPGCFLIAASGMAGMGSPNAIRTRRITKRFYLCGDETSEVSENNCLLAPAPIAAITFRRHASLLSSFIPQCSIALSKAFCLSVRFSHFISFCIYQLQHLYFSYHFIVSKRNIGQRHVLQHGLQLIYLVEV